MSGISRSYLFDLENSNKKNPTLDKLYKIAIILKVNIKDLFYTKFDIQELQNKMYKKIDKFGLNSKEVMEISQLIDLLINIDIKEQT